MPAVEGFDALCRFTRAALGRRAYFTAVSREVNIHLSIL